MKLIFFGLLMMACVAGYFAWFQLSADSSSLQAKIQQIDYGETENSKGQIMSNDDQQRRTLPQSEDEWKKVLTADQYYVLRKKGTERAFSGSLWNSDEHGVYRCAGCGQSLFNSDCKFDSGTGWPSFWQPVADKNVQSHEDNTLFMRRTEVICSRCQGHLGHVFDDGPEPTGLRYCINSAALKMDAEQKK